MPSSRVEYNLVQLAAPRLQTSSNAADPASMVLVTALGTLRTLIALQLQQDLWGAGRSAQADSLRENLPHAKPNLRSSRDKTYERSGEHRLVGWADGSD